MSVRPRPTEATGSNGPLVLRASRGILAAVAGLFVGAAVYTSVLISERQDALGRISRYNVAWLAAQAAAEHYRLQREVAAHMIPGSGVGLDEVQLRLDILANRTSVMRGAEFGEVIRREPELRTIIGDLEAAVASAEPLVARLDQPGMAVRLLDLLSGLDGRLMRLGSMANAHVGDLVAQDQEELGRLHHLYSGIVAALVLCGLGLIVLMLWHNRLLRQVHSGLRALTLDLTRTTTDLEHANGMAQRANAGLHVQNERFDAALSNMMQGLCMVDAHGQLIVCNRRYVEMFGLLGAAEPGRPLAEVWRFAVASGRYPAEMLAVIGAEQEVLVRDGRAETLLREHPTGPALTVSHRPMADGGWVATYEDVSEQRRVEARVAHMAHHDALTDLPNRVLFHDRIREALNRLQRQPDASVAVLCLDLDHFKDVNDTLGHSAGDALLQAVADRLRGCIRQTDVVARLGGDEFALLQSGGDQPHDAAALAERVVAALEAPFGLDGHRIRIGASVGIALAPGDGADADRLLRCADMALYRAKADGRGGHRFFEPDMDAQLHARRAVQVDLHDALGRDQFEVHYQPIVNLAAGEAQGFEALLRWHHPTRGMVSPGEFIPLAEEAGLIIPIGKWVMRRACADAAAWPGNHRVAVNLSPVQFSSPDLAEAVAEALAHSCLAPSRLELEITETVLLRDNEAVLATLHRLRALGVRIALDDFGIGYSSLSYLRSFPFDKIKIDQSFVRDMEHRADCAAIVESVAHLATSLGMGATAEGVETEEHLRRVRAAGCTEAQGYHLGRPRPNRELFRPPAAERLDGIHAVA